VQTVVLHGQGDFGEWRDAARRLLAARVPPETVVWSTDKGGSLFDAGPLPAAPEGQGARVPKAFINLAEAVICHSDPGRFDLLYRVLVRLQTERELLTIPADADVASLNRLEKSVRRDCHKMTAFVRFSEVEQHAPDADTAQRRRFLAWFEPDHYILARIAPFFARRFADMDWLILTPKGSIACTEGEVLLSDQPAEKPSLDDPADKLWLTYYASIFNPARLKVKAMQAEMPKKYWKNLPEAALIPELVAAAPSRVAAMAEAEMRAPPAFHARLQARRQDDMSSAPMEGLPGLRQQAATCTRCALHAMATQTVFGEGPDQADLMIVGEQPGDREDLAGRPFVGPAGQLLDQVLGETGIDRRTVYVTNAVKHFKFEPRGKRRIHQKPDAGEVQTCRWWLQQELDFVNPRLVIAMGKTALFALTGKDGRLADRRGMVIDWQPGRALIATVHPSYLLRLPDARLQAEETARFRDDLAKAHEWLASDRARGGCCEG
jgi:probable DNA metabolism protein